MSKQDTHFVNMFSLVIGGLFAIAIIFFVAARALGARIDSREMMSHQEYQKSVAARVAPFEQEAVAGQSNAALAIKPLAATAEAGGSSGVAIPTSGKQLFAQTCSACHGPGIAGAPKAGDKAAWARHIAKGLPILYQHALHGFTGSSGTMPAKGGRTNVPDALVEQAVNYMVSLVDPAMVKGKKR